jgi:hypothetical protein
MYESGIIAKAETVALNSRCVVVDASADWSSGGCGVVSGTVIDDSSGVVVSNLLVWGNLILIVADVEAESSWVDVAVTEKEQGTKDWLGKDIKNTVEDGFGVGGDNIATLAEAPGDWVDEPEEDSPDAADQVGSADVCAKCTSIFGIEC